MLAFIVRRLFQSILVMLAVGFISFSLFNFVGDPVNNMVGIEATIEERERMAEALGLNESVSESSSPGSPATRLQGDFGQSYRLSVPVE